MVSDPRILSTGSIALTTEELAALEKTLKSGDRGGFYNAFVAMTGSHEAELQVAVNTFSGLTGGGAFAANRFLQEAFGPGTWRQRTVHRV